MFAKTYLTTALLALFALSGCASVPAGVQNSVPVQAVPMSHYEGKWLEIGRRPMWLTDNCVAGYTTYTPGARPGEIAIEDGCHKTTPDGKLKTIKARGVLLDAGGDNAKLRAHYPLFITWDYWVRYEAPDHSWFISADAKMHNLWIYARNVPSDAERAVMVAKAKSLGYDVTQLEFPTP